MIAGYSILTLLLVALAGVGAGFVGYAVGASSLISYPALLALGVPPVIANASNTVGVLGTGFGGALGARKELRGLHLRAAIYVSIGVIGGILGALLLLELDPKVFECVVPPLIALSSAAIALNPRGRAEARQAAADARAQAAGLGLDDTVASTDGHAARNGHSRPLVRTQTEPLSEDPWWVWLGVSCCAIYSGYFGAGAGTLVLAVLDAAGIGPFHQVNALKTLIGWGANMSASVVFIVRGVVDWPLAIVMCLGCFAGSYIAPPVTRKIPARIMRIAAVIAGIALTVDLAIKTY
ncbi:sulfite exporter TauE/SafE family protein [Bifidobacterium apri]|uniref:Probable membrane transporter protein n=1 Tax=Bifidobacterium apri TaxID=1769423 RepID=A0A6A2VZ76_9BIFI|nr:sulfite exporter TauE/SafE family protein [Bifidobacterium apri]KAB8300776.1 permease [Bifidobacterium apri]